jgi:peptidyl-dipeptidase Dcp
MSLRLFFACALLNVAQVTAMFAVDLKDNPLTVESVLPYQYPPFDKIKDENFIPAIEAGMREQLKEIEPIANNPEKPTFDNTIVALERTGRLLDRAERTFSNLNACDTNPTRQKIDKEMAPKLAAHHDEIFLNPKLFARVQALYEQRDKLGLDSGIRLFARTLLQGFRARGSQAVRFRQGETERDERRVGQVADGFRAKCFEGAECVVGGRR